MRVIDDAVRRELEAVAQRAACELAEVELKGGVLRLVLDRREGGVTLDDCVTVSREASALLDVLDFDPGRYVLEVSSPGLDRPLIRSADYERFVGRLARITYDPPDGGERRTVHVRLAAYDPRDGGRVTVEDEQGATLVLPFSAIRKARLEVEL